MELTEEQKKYLTQDIDTSRCKNLIDVAILYLLEAVSSMARGVTNQIKSKN